MMLKAPRRRLFVRAIAVAFGFAVFTTALYAAHSWAGYHWARTSNPFTLKLGDNVSSAWDGYLATTSSDWSESSVLDTTIVAGGTTGRKCRATSGRVEVCNASYGRNGWLGLASIWASGGHITQGTVKVNDTYFNMAQYNNPDEKNHVMCQEVGHTFGLGHTSEDGSSQQTCMDYSQDPASTHPNAHDYGQLEAIYGHLDSTTTVNQSATASKMPPAMRDLDYEGPGQWGKLIHGSRAEGHSVYELDFGHGNKVITHVTWARDEN